MTTLENLCGCMIFLSAIAAASTVESSTITAAAFLVVAGIAWAVAGYHSKAKENDRLMREHKPVERNVGTPRHDE